MDSPFLDTSVFNKKEEESLQTNPFSFFVFRFGHTAPKSVGGRWEEGGNGRGKGPTDENVSLGRDPGSRSPL